VWIDLPGGLVLDTTVLATGFTSNTTYEWHVRTQCDTSNFSNWSASGLFTTTGNGAANDNCGNAMLLTVESSCVTTFASNVDATASTPPPVGGCFANGYRDVWFKFTMPDVPNPMVTIRTSAGSLGNAVMEVYSGTDCNILSVIACEDNNDNGNGSSMPVINLTGIPNTTIWVRVWGFDGSTGTFTICVFNHISFNYAGVPSVIVPEQGEPLGGLVDAVQPSLELDGKSEIKISPNPVNDELHVKVLQTEESRVIGLRIMDLSGKLMFTQGIEKTEEVYFNTDVDVSSFVPGIYLLQVQTTRGMMVEKISVIR
ncbi:MAG TPA: T9SS type A sorting domain-containing protein, partial [Saprospiraceae bacterium]|nr:T9SS type A sorting domain-containing protein [Saprospiraceae bacterium]